MPYFYGTRNRAWWPYVCRHFPYPDFPGPMQHLEKLHAPRIIFFALWVAAEPVFGSPQVVDLRSFTPNKNPFTSFPRRRESSLFGIFRTPTFAGVKGQGNAQSIKSAALWAVPGMVCSAVRWFGRADARCPFSKLSSFDPFHPFIKEACRNQPGTAGEKG